MKIAVIIVRVLMGLMFLFASIVVLFNLMPHPEMKGNAKLFMDGIAATVYFMPLLKITELVCGIAFVSGLFVPLATVVIFPIVLNIVFYHAFVAPEGLPVAIALLLGNLFLAFAYRKHYATLVAIK
jgi:putative oxidoreductase